MLLQSKKETRVRQYQPSKKYDWSEVMQLKITQSKGFVEIRSRQIIICGPLKRIHMKNNTIQVETHWAAKAEIDRFGCLKTNWFFLNEGRPLILLDFENLTFGFLIHQTSRGRVVVFGKNSRIYLDYAGYLNYDLIKSPRKRS